MILKDLMKDKIDVSALNEKQLQNFYTTKKKKYKTFLPKLSKSVYGGLYGGFYRPITVDNNDTDGVGGGDGGGGDGGGGD